MEEFAWRVRNAIYIILLAVAGCTIISGCDEKPTPLHMVFWPPDMVPHPDLPQPDHPEEPELV